MNVAGTYTIPEGWSAASSDGGVICVRQWNYGRQFHAVAEAPLDDDTPCNGKTTFLALFLITYDGGQREHSRREFATFEEAVKFCNSQVEEWGRRGLSPVDEEELVREIGSAVGSRARFSGHDPDYDAGRFLVSCLVAHNLAVRAQRAHGTLV